MIRNHHLIAIALTALVACGSSSSPLAKDAGVGSSAPRRYAIGAPSAGPVNIFGGLTANKLPKASGGSVVDSDISDSSGTIDFTNGAAKNTIAVATGAQTIAGLLTLSAGITGLPAQTCTAGQAETAQSTTGAQTCTTLINGTANTTTKYTGANAIGNAWALDDGTTWGVSGKFTIAEATGTATVSGDVVLNTAGKAVVLVQNSGTATTSKLEAYSGSPNGAVTSTNKGDAIYDTSTPAPWFATAASSSVWMREPGVYLGQQKFTASSGTYTPNTLARVVRVRMIAGGGGGGGASGTAAQFAAGGGGSTGAMLEVYVNPGSNTLITGGAYAVGAAGTAGSSSAGNGGNGGDTTIVVQGVTYTAKGGSGGAGMATGTTLANSNGATPQAGSTALSGACVAVSTCVVALTWGNGDVAVRISGSGGWGGNGGSTSLGGGGQYAGVATGTTATGYGGGGAGAGAQTTSNAGGAGFQGVITVDEWD